MIYVMKTDAIECWPGFTMAAFRNWGPMIRLAVPGLVMIMAEFLAFEILTLASANFSAEHLAANTILQSLSVLTYQLPFPLSIAGSTRVANLVGAGLPEAGKCTARVMLVIGCIIGVFNMLALSIFRDYIPYLYTKDPDVIALAARTLPVNAAFQLWDSLAAQCNGIMRGIGKQGVGGIISLVAFYGVSKRNCGGRVPCMLICALGCPSYIVWDWIRTALGVVWTVGRTCDCAVCSSVLGRCLYL
jgi:MATE family multidrug resistance protein